MVKRGNQFYTKCAGENLDVLQVQLPVIFHVSRFKSRNSKITSTAVNAPFFDTRSGDPDTGRVTNRKLVVVL